MFSVRVLYMAFSYLADLSKTYLVCPVFNIFYSYAASDNGSPESEESEEGTVTRYV